MKREERKPAPTSVPPSRLVINSAQWKLFEERGFDMRWYIAVETLPDGSTRAIGWIAR
jgi:hypothetical protein